MRDFDAFSADPPGGFTPRPPQDIFETEKG